MTELDLFRTTAEVKNLPFLLSITWPPSFLRVLSVIIVLPFVTADYERLFSKVGYIKTADRNRLGDILNAPLLIYDSTEEKKNLTSADKLPNSLGQGHTTL